MALKTVTFPTCDGDGKNACGVELRRPGDGVVLRGPVMTAGPTGEAKVLVAGSNDGVALCWNCLHRRVADPTRRVEQPRIMERPSYEDTYRDPYRSPGHGATGPLPPPDLPRCVHVAARFALAGGDP